MYMLFISTKCQYVFEFAAAEDEWPNAIWVPKRKLEIQEGAQLSSK